MTGVRFISKLIRKALAVPDYPRVFHSLEEADRHQVSTDERQVIMLDDRVIKRQNPDCARIELEKTKRGARIGERCGWFQVPQILDADESVGEIHFERLRDVVPLWFELRHHQGADDILLRLARSLAAIHNELKLPPEMSIESIPPWGSYSTRSTVYIHGDFISDNILVAPETRHLWIIDWWNDVSRTLGPCYYDIAKLILTILQNRYMGLDRIRNIDEKVDLLLRTYIADAQHPCDVQGFQEYTRSTFFPAMRSVLLPSSRSLWRQLLYHWLLGTSHARFSRLVGRFD